MQTSKHCKPHDVNGAFIWRIMQEHGLYFGSENFYNLIRSTGGQWNDSKERPIVCMMRSIKITELYWAIPIGNWRHRDYNTQNRIKKFMNFPENDLRSCYYHVGNTDVKSIFFISDTVPIIEKYISREYIGKYTGKHYTIRNKALLSVILNKLKRILAFEKNRPNYFRQHITDVENILIKELER